MKRIKLADFSFLGTAPQEYRRTHRFIHATLAPKTARPPEGTMMVAVSGAPAFVSTLQMQCSQKAEAGVLLYHTNSSYITVGIVASEIRVTTVIQGWKQEFRYSEKSDSTSLTWQIERGEADFTISVQQNDETLFQPVGTFTLPGTERSVSFGWYAANASASSATVEITAFTYQHTP